jgi:valyl-tRNA synthetase
MGDIPFRTVYIHGTVRDDSGRKMSKSLGNSIDPLTVIERFSADALRFSLMMITATGQDVYLSDDKFEIGRNFGTKLWNASRFLQMHAAKHPGACRFGPDLRPDPALLSADDHHILARVQAAADAVAEHLERYRFNDAAHELYDFVWHQFCDWYVEAAKDVLYGEDGPRRRQTLAIMHHVLSVSLRLLHPTMPFLTEELWHAMGFGGDGDSIMTAPWPERGAGASVPGLAPDAAQAAYVEARQELVRAGRALKADYGIAPATPAAFIVKPAGPEAAAALALDATALRAALKASELTLDAAAAPKGLPSTVTALGAVFMRLEGVVDVEAEKRKLAAELQKVRAAVENADRKLANPGFVGKARPDVVEAHRAQRAEHDARRQKLEHLLEMLGAG